MCIFCKIAAKQIPAAIVYEDDKILAFKDVVPQAPVHILVIPKVHAKNIAELDDFSIVGRIFEVIREIAAGCEIEKEGFRVVLNHGQQAGQAVDHLHFHLLGGRKLTWPPG